MYISPTFSHHWHKLYHLRSRPWSFFYDRILQKDMIFLGLKHGANCNHLYSQASYFLPASVSADSYNSLFFRDLSKLQTLISLIGNCQRRLKALGSHQPLAVCRSPSLGTTAELSQERMQQHIRHILHFLFTYHTHLKSESTSVFRVNLLYENTSFILS